MPVFMYRKDEARLFQSLADVPAGEGWVDSPAKVGADLPAPAVAEPAPEPEDDARGGLIAEAEALGIRVDGRWSDKRLASEIAKRK